MRHFHRRRSRPTQRALDGWDSAAFSSIFHARTRRPTGGSPALEVLSTPAHTRVTQAVELTQYLTIPWSQAELPFARPQTRANMTDDFSSRAAARPRRGGGLAAGGAAAGGRVRG
jgi:hypothetical protein